jgi:hypothetical protein
VFRESGTGARFCFLYPVLVLSFEVDSEGVFVVFVYGGCRMGEERTVSMYSPLAAFGGMVPGK